MINSPISLKKTKCLSFLLGAVLFNSGCQLVSIQQNQIDQAIQKRSQTIISGSSLSADTQSLLAIVSYADKTCLSDFKACSEHIQKQTVIPEHERYSALSELYLAQALDLEKKCKTHHCFDQALFALDLSLRYSYAYLFKAGTHPHQHAFDLRQMQVRTLYNYALSRLISLQYQHKQFKTLPAEFSIANRRYQIDTQYYPELKDLTISSLQSSYTLNFSGFDKVNRQDGLGAEFVLAKSAEHDVENEFIVDPAAHYKDRVNPRLHSPQYLTVTATLQPVNTNASAQDIISGKTDLKLSVYNPYRYKFAHLNQQEYALTANYTAPFAHWLAHNQLGKFGYLSLLDRAESLRMPHLYMLEPYQPHKKVVVLVHGLASSPETWVNLTNNILGDPTLRENYQVWMMAYSTNMPILESRFQIHALLKQAFAQVEPNSNSAKDAVLIGHSMGGIISRLLVSDADISKQAIPLMNYEQYIRLQQNPIIAERFQFKPDLPFSRAIFVAAPHRGSDLTDRWYVDIAKKLVKLPTSFFDQVDVKLDEKNSTQGLIHSGPDDLSPNSRFMQLTHQVIPKAGMPYHSIIGNAKNSNDPAQMSDGIVPYASSHLDRAQSEKIFKGGHSIHAKSETILELRRILHEHLDKKP